MVKPALRGRRRHSIFESEVDEPVTYGHDNWKDV